MTNSENTEKTPKSGLIERLSRYAAALDYDPQEAIFKEVMSLRSRVQQLEDELASMKAKSG
jgi:hypothetical protein